MKEGWICPRCKRSNAPHIDSCDCPTDLTFEEINIKMKPSLPPQPPYIWPDDMERYRRIMPKPKPYQPPGLGPVLIYGIGVGEQWIS